MSTKNYQSRLPANSFPTTAANIGFFRRDSIGHLLGSVSATAALATLSYALLEPYRIIVHKFHVRMPGLPKSAEGMRLAQLSDLHCSALTSARLIDRAVELCNAETPDAVLLTGDYVSRRNSYMTLSPQRLLAKPVMDYAARVAESLGALRAPLGVFAVAGNHDRANGRYDSIAALLESVGVQSLLNSSARPRGLALIGVDDLRAGRPEWRTACQGIGRSEAQVILSHNPRLLSVFAGRNCLMLSGHTHSGQVHLPFTSFRRTPNDMQGSMLQGGWYSDGDARLYVSAGVGSVHFPLRFCCPPEIAIFTLLPAD